MESGELDCIRKEVNCFIKDCSSLILVILYFSYPIFITLVKLSNLYRQTGKIESILCAVKCAIMTGMSRLNAGTHRKACQEGQMGRKRIHSQYEDQNSILIASHPIKRTIKNYGLNINLIEKRCQEKFLKNLKKNEQNRKMF